MTAESQPARDDGDLPEEAGEVIPLLEPRDGLPPVIESAEALVGKELGGADHGTPLDAYQRGQRVGNAILDSSCRCWR